MTYISNKGVTSTQTDEFEEQPFGGLEIAGQSDIIVRIDSASVNNLEVIAGYDIIIIKD